MNGFDIDGSVGALGLDLYYSFISFSVVFLSDDGFLVLDEELLLYEIIGVIIHGDNAALHALLQLVGD